MAHQADDNVIENVVQLLCESGLSHMADAMRLMLNEAMRMERSQALNAGPYQRTEKRRGYANGFKPKTLSTRVGDLALQVPQVRGEIEFYPSALERGVRSERALKCAIAEMYVKGVSTRKVTAVMSELCGLEVSSTQVRRATRLLDEELNQWRKRAVCRSPSRPGHRPNPQFCNFYAGSERTSRLASALWNQICSDGVHERLLDPGVPDPGVPGLRSLLGERTSRKECSGAEDRLSDCQWVQYLHSVGLLRGSFRPSAEICAIRSLWRHRASLIQMAAEHVLHMQKALDQMNVQIHRVLNDITGVSRLKIIDAVLAGERDPLTLAGLCHWRSEE